VSMTPAHWHTLGSVIDAVEPAMRRRYGARLSSVITALLVDAMGAASEEM